MKKIFILCIALIGLFASCKKSSSSGGSSLSATVGGTNKNFSTSAYAAKASQGGFYGYGMAGFASVSTEEEIDISITNEPSGDTIIAGTYSDTSSRFNVDLEYLTSASLAGIDYEGGTDWDGYNSSVGNPVTNHVKLVITSVTATTISGTFSGNVYVDGDATTTPFSITSGSFSLPIRQL